MTFYCAPAQSLSSQSAIGAEVDSVTPPAVQRNIVERIIDYFDDSNKPHPDRKIDFSIMGGPSYSASTSVQLAVIAAGTYRRGVAAPDSCPPTRMENCHRRLAGGLRPTTESNISLIGQASVTGFWRLGVRGNHFSVGDRFRLDYNADFSHFPLDYWGIGYASESDDANRTRYTNLTTTARVEALWLIAPDLYLGPSARLNYSKATKVKRPELWDGQSLDVLSVGVGIGLEYDNRDVPTFPSRGVRVLLCQRFYPRFIGNKYPFSQSELTASAYHRFWRSGVVAVQAHVAATFGSAPWSMLPCLDASGAVRSYYEGRYRDRNVMDAVVEVRQHVWRRNSLVVWGGGGWVFPRWNRVRETDFLPSAGLGYRWELKKNINVRVDFGVGRHSTSFTVGLNEVF